MIRVSFIAALLLFPLLTPVAAENSPYAAIHKHALAATKEDEASIESLAAYLIKPAKDDTEKTRAIFRWLTDRIAYESTLLKQAEPNRPENVLKDRKAVCMGYAELFTELAKAAGLEVVSIRGFAKGYTVLPPDKLIDSGNHRWNAVKIDGTWRLLDATWGAGSLQKEAFSKSLNDYFFLTPPDKLIYSHFPKDPQWQLLTPLVSEEEFLKNARTLNHHILYYGVASSEIKKTLAGPSFRDFVKVLDMPADGGKFAIKEAPLDRYLKAGTKCKFKFESESTEFPQMALLHQNQWTLIPRKGNAFELTLALRPDPNLRVVRYKQKGNARSYHNVLEYVVE